MIISLKGYSFSYAKHQIIFVALLPGDCVVDSTSDVIRGGWFDQALFDNFKKEPMIGIWRIDFETELSLNNFKAMLDIRERLSGKTDDWMDYVLSLLQSDSSDQ